jgi:hypothetical protein
MKTTIAKIGFYSNIICAIHCTIFPLFMVFLPTAGLYLFVDESIELVVLFVSTFFNLFNLCLGYKKHKSNKALSVFAFGFMFFLIAKLLLDHNHGKNIEFDLFNVCMITGGIMTLFSNIVNNKLCHSCSKCEINRNG